MSAFARVSRISLRLLATASIAVLAAGCSSLPSWTDPDTWNSADDQPATTATDTGAPAPAGGQGRTVAEATDQYPVLADTPSKAPPASTSDEQKQVSEGLVADRAQAQYSGEALQAGKEPSAAPPPPADPTAAISSPPGAEAAGAATLPPPVPPSPPAAGASAAATPSTPGTLPAESAGEAAPPPPPPPQTASIGTPPPPAAAPAAPTPAPSNDDAAFGFQPSHAPPLDPTVAQMMNGGAPVQNRRLAARTPSVPAAASATFAGAPAAVVLFPTNSIGLNPAAVSQVQAAVAAFRQRGGQGYVRVIGHSASGAPGDSADKQMMQSFERAQACATAVAREIIRQGVPAKRVLVDATSTLAGDEQRRAEIFLSN